MGRQIAVSLSAQAEIALLAFLRSIAPVRLYRPRASSREELELDTFAAAAPADATVLIWNTAFAWQPQVQESEPGAHQHPWVRIANYTIGPVLEYSRSLHPTGKGAGRIYWPKVLPHPNPSAYDVAAFERWYGQVVRWIKQNAEVGSSDQGVTYFLRAGGA